MGGLVVIDFIDMLSSRNQRAVENRVRDALEIDRARMQVGRISRFGLLEMSRQRLRPSLGETSAIVCPRCTGQGTIRDTKSLALSILRLLEEEAIKERSNEVRAIVPVDVAAYLLNEKRSALGEIEQVCKTRVLVIPNPNFETPHFEVQRLRDDEVDGDHEVSSYNIDITVPDTDAISDSHSADIPVQEAAVKRIAPQAAPPAAAPAAAQPATASQATPAAPKKGLLARLWSGLLGADSEPEQPVEVAKPKASAKPASRGEQKPRGDRNRRRRGGSQNKERGEQRPRNQDNRQREAGSDDNREQPKRERTEGGERGNGQRRRRGGRDGQRRRPETVTDTANEAVEPVAQEVQASQESQESSDNQEKPRKRPSGMKRGEPQRRRRGRGRKPATETETGAESETGTAEAIAEGTAADTTIAVASAASAVAAVAAVAAAEVATSSEPQAEAEVVSEVVAEAVSTAPAEPVAVAEQAELPLADAPAVDTAVEDTPVEEIAAEEVPAPATPSAIEPPAPVAASEEPVVASSAGLNEQGRAVNDPRVEASPVDVVEIVTSHPELFSDVVAPPVAPSAKVVQRASNDPRAKAKEVKLAEAAGQS